MKILIILAISTFFSGAISASQIPVLSCVGTEPFWGISTDTKGFLSFSSPLTEGKKFYSKTTIKNADGTTEGFAFQIEAHDMANSSLKLNVVRAECNDGMSDTTYTYTALVDINDSLLMGCCN